jgi:hypothetical protein
MCSNWFRHASQKKIERHLVGPKGLSSRVPVAPQ